MKVNNYKTYERVRDIRWFTAVGRHIVSNRWLCIICIAVITILAGAGLQKIKYDTSVENWFTVKTWVFANKKKFEKYFGNNDVVGIHIKADDVFSPEIVTMLDSLGNELESNVPFADNVISIADMEYSYSKGMEVTTEDLIPDNFDPDNMEKYRQRALSKERIKGKLVSGDCTETWLILNLLPYPDNWEKKHGIPPENAVGKKVVNILDQKKYREHNIRSVGTPVFGYEELLFTEAESVRLLVLTFVMLSIFLAIFYRSVQRVIIPLLTAAVSIIIVYGTMGHLGIKINAFLFAVPVVLSLAVSLGYSVHLFNYYNKSLIEEQDRKKAVERAIGKSGWPTAFAAFTTMGALLSFLAISLIPIRWLGLTSAVMIFVVYIIVFSLTGALLSFCRQPENRNYTQHRHQKQTDRYFTRLGRFVFKNAKAISLITLIILAIMVFGIFRLKVNIDTKHSYGMEVPYIKRMVEVANTQIGSFDSYNIILDLKKEDAVKNPAKLEKFNTFTEKVHQLSLTEKTSSVLSIIKDMNRLMHKNKDAYYKIPDSKSLVAQLLMIYETSGGANLYDWISEDYSILRLKVSTNNLDAKETMYEMEKLRKWSSEMFPNAKFSITGGMPEFAVLNQYVAKGQIKSLILALTVIGVLMMIVFGSIKTGLIGLIPNISPVIVVGGMMGLLQIPLDFLTVTIAPMILGLAVDDTIHFINHIKHNFKRTGNYVGSSINTLKVVGKALVTTSVIIIISFIIYLTSPINMMVYLGLFVVVGIFSAMVANLLLTPVIMRRLKPFGKESHPEFPANE